MNGSGLATRGITGAVLKVSSWKKNIAWECYGDQCLVTGQKRRLIGQGGQGGGFVSEVAPSALSIDSSANVFGDW